VRHIRFPPKWRLVLVPEAPRTATALGVTLYTASKPAPLAAQRVLWAGARVFGGRALPGRREQWQPALSEQAFAELRTQLQAAIGRAPDGFASYESPQREPTTGLTLLACAGPDSLLVRVRPTTTELALERDLSEHAANHPARTFRVPRVAGSGAVDGWHWIGYHAIATRPHAPVRRAPAALYDEISTLVEAVATRPRGTPDHWRGAHGDLTPWNLRRSNTGTWLIDWEDARWAPPGTDEVYFAAIIAATRPGPVRPLELDESRREAARCWLASVAERPADSDPRLRDRLLTLLGG
jgi:hypothetical protein